MNRMIEKLKSRKSVMRALLGVMAVVVLSVFVVWPALADETVDETTEVISEEEMDSQEPESEGTEDKEEPVAEPTEEPVAEPTEEPVAQEEEEEPVKEPKEAEEEEESTESSDSVSDQSQPEQSQPEQTETASESQETSGEQPEPTGSETSADVKKSKKSTRVNREKAGGTLADAPEFETDLPSSLTWEYLEPEGKNELSVKLASNSNGYTVTYQWYDKSGAIEKATERKYTIDEKLGAGTYEYWCVATYTEGDDSASTTSTHVKITIDKRSPKITDFNESSVPSTLEYTGETQTIAFTPKDGVEGIGTAVIRAYVDDEIRPLKTVNTYDKVELVVSGGANYSYNVIPIDGTITIHYVELSGGISAYTLSGTKGNVIEGVQWYRSDVTLKAPKGFKINDNLNTNGGYTSDTLTYSTEGADVGPSTITLQNTKGGLTDDISVSSISIDKTAPTGTFEYDEASGLTSFFFKDRIEVSVVPSDNMDSVLSPSIAKCEMAYAATGTSTSRLSWQETDSLTVDNLSNYTVYARITDAVGNVSNVLSSEGIVIDSTDPEITCGNNAIKENGKYIADKKTFKVTDDNLDTVTITGGPDPGTKDVEGTTCTFELRSPDTDGESYTYTIIAEDKAGNSTTKVITMTNPNLDVTIDKMVFKTSEGDNPVYGYTAADLGKAIELKKGSAYNVPQNPVIDSVTVIPDGDGNSYFTYDTSSATIRPVSGLEVGTYSGAFRVDYTGGEEESSTTFECEMTVDKKPVSVEYKDYSVKAYYHEVPVFSANSYVFGEFVGKDTPTSLGLTLDMEAFSGGSWQSISSNNLRTTDLAGVSMRPAISETKNYEWQIVETEPLPDTLDDTTILKVERREVPEGLVVTGTEGTNGWYISDVTLGVSDGYSMSITTDTEEKSALDTEISYSPTTTRSYEDETKGEMIYFYIMNRSTGEISSLMSKEIKIDKTEPTDAEITVGDNSVREFLNLISFGQLFNETKEVVISGAETISDIPSDSGLPKIQYYMADKAMDLTQVQAITNWTDYTGKFYLEPGTYARVVIYVKLVNDAGLTTYISSDGMSFDVEPPKVEADGVLNQKNKKDRTEYVAEELNVTVQDPQNNLETATLYEGTNISGAGTNIMSDTDGKGHWTVSTEGWEEGDSKTYTIVAVDSSKNLCKEILVVVKPIYDITADNLVLDDVVYGYSTAPSTSIRYKNTSNANADATIAEVNPDDETHFEVTQKEDGSFVVAAKKNLDTGTYATNLTIVYNRGKEVNASCTVEVQKAKLKATYLGQSLYYHMVPDFDESTIQVTGFVKNETAQTAAGYVAPTIDFSGAAEETCILTPANGRADNYEFEYASGVLTVKKRQSTKGSKGQYEILGTLSPTSWYTSNITIQPSEGYKVTVKEDGSDVQDQLVLTQDTDDGKEIFYLVNETSGEMYDATEFNYKKDVVAPSIENIVDGETYVVNSKEVTVKDAYLSNVTVNGEAQQIVKGTSTFTLSADQKTTAYVIVAADRAGNATEATVILKQPSELEDTDETGTALTGESSSTDAGTIRKNVQLTDGAPKTTISTSTSDMAKAVLTSAETNAVNNGSDLNIDLRVKNVDGNVNQKDKEAIIAALGDYIVGQYLDITVWKTVGSGTPKKVVETNSPISVTVTIPQSLRNTNEAYNREFAMFRVHNGVVSMLQDQDSVSNTITIRSDQFSTYALAYRDVSVSASSLLLKKKTSKSSSSGSGSSSSSGTTTVSTGSSGSSGTSGKLVTTSPATGDSAPIVPIAIIMVLALAGMIAVIVIRKRSQASK